MEKKFSLDIDLKNEKKGDNFENLIEKVFSTIPEYKNIKVSKKPIIKKGKCNQDLTRQIDLIGDFIDNTQGKKVRVFIEAKNHKNKISQGTFSEILLDKDHDPSAKLIFISRNGFQKGAINYAKEWDVDLFILQDELLDNKENENTIREIILNFHIRIPDPETVKLEILEKIPSNLNNSINLRDPIFPFSSDEEGNFINIDNILFDETKFSPVDIFINFGEGLIFKTALSWGYNLIFSSTSRTLKIKAVLINKISQEKKYSLDITETI